jgi:hypothetical protein
MSDLDAMFNGSRPAEIEQFVDWLHGLDIDELDFYVTELEAFAGDESRFGAFAAAALPVAQTLQALAPYRDVFREGWDPTFGDFDQFWSALRAVTRATHQLGMDLDPVSVFEAATEVAMRRKENQ